MRKLVPQLQNLYHVHGHSQITRSFLNTYQQLQKKTIQQYATPNTHFSSFNAPKKEPLTNRQLQSNILIKVSSSNQLLRFKKLFLPDLLETLTASEKNYHTICIPKLLFFLIRCTKKRATKLYYASENLICQTQAPNNQQLLRSEKFFWPHYLETF